MSRDIYTGKPISNLTSNYFKDKVILITGASSGIGAATAILFAKFGAKLSLTGRNLENLNKTSQVCQAQSSALFKPLIIQADLNNEKDIANILDATLKEYRKLDVLVNNAGIVGTGTIENTSMAHFDEIFGVNVRSMFYMTSLAIPYLIESKGAIVNVSSVSGLTSYSGALAYNMSKSAVDQFTKCIALELASHGIRVNSVNPGVVMTELQKRSGYTDAAYQKFLERSKSTHPLGRVAQAEEVANAIAFLASDMASFVTGVNLPVCGGRDVAGLH